MRARAPFYLERLFFWWFAASCLFSGFATAADTDDPVDPEELPSLKEALDATLHAPFRLRKGLIDLRYDFSREEQGKDFVSERGISFGAGEVRINRGTIKVEPGRLSLKEVELRHALPLRAVQTVRFVVTGLEDFYARLGAGKQNIHIRLGTLTSIDVDNSRFSFSFDDFRQVNLLPGKSYKIDIVVGRRDVVVKLDGKATLRAQVDREMPPVDRVSFSSMSQGKPAVRQLQLEAWVDEDAVVVVSANRGRGETGKAPLWRQQFTADGEHFRVSSPESQARADERSSTFEAACKALLADFPPPPGWELKRDVYLFRDPHVLEAYSGKKRSQALPGGAILLLDRSPPTEEDDGTVVIEIDDLDAALGADGPPGVVLGAVIQKLYGEIPYWWREGLRAYYSSFERGELRPGAVRPELVAGTRKYLSEGTGPPLSRLLAAAEFKDAYPRAVSWAWIYFLHKGGGGSHQKYLQQFHAALLAGKSGEEAGQEVFPTPVFNELYPRFQEYLEGL